MRADLDKKLVADFPMLYQDRYASMQQTAMCWGFDCGDGWEPLIRGLSEKIEAYNNDHPESPVIAFQVKEKFGGLWFYVDGAIKEILDLIQEYEERSEKICEQCGKPGKLRKGAWLLTLCDECHKRRDG